MQGPAPCWRCGAYGRYTDEDGDAFCLSCNRTIAPPAPVLATKKPVRPRKLSERVCPACGKTFRPLRATSKCCSMRCAGRWRVLAAPVIQRKSLPSGRGWLRVVAEREAVPAA